MKVDAEGIAIDGLWRGNLGRLWFFTFDGNQSTLLPVRGGGHLHELIDAIGRSPTPLCRPPPELPSRWPG